MARKKKTISEIMAEHGIGVYKEAQASCSLDGDTRCCMACVQKVEHVCGKRPMTVAERELVEAALTPEPWLGVDYRRFELCIEAVRAERKEKT